MLAAEVGFSHRSLNGDGLALAKVAADGELCQRPLGGVIIAISINNSS